MYYYSSFSTEVVFHCLPKMPNVEKLAQKKRLLMTNKVVISFVEDLSSYNPKQLGIPDLHINIAVVPLPSGILFQPFNNIFNFFNILKLFFSSLRIVSNQIVYGETTWIDWTFG